MGTLLIRLSIVHSDTISIPTIRKNLEFVDRVHELDQRLIDEGRIKPTHMIAAMKVQSIHQRVDRHLTPEFCVRRS